jgi:hypothetical protein
MAKVHVIARFVAGDGKESQLRALLQGMLTLAPNRDANCTNSTNRTPRDASICTKDGKVRRRSTDTWGRRTLSA